MWKKGMGQMFYQEISKGMQKLKARVVEDLVAGKTAQDVLISHVE
jgi:hypothetical protein